MEILTVLWTFKMKKFVHLQPTSRIKHVFIIIYSISHRTDVLVECISKKKNKQEVRMEFWTYESGSIRLGIILCATFKMIPVVQIETSSCLKLYLNCV